MRRALDSAARAVASAAVSVLALTSASAAELVRSRVADHVEHIRAALVERGAPAGARITLATPEAAIPLVEGAPLPVESVSYNPATGRFLIRTAGADGTPVAVAGSALVPIAAAVLVRDFARNEIVTEVDIDWVEISDARPDAYLTDGDAVIGKAARRPLKAGAPIRKADLAAPTLIRRGATATVILEAPGLRLTQAAVAQANGGAGDVIAFRNLNSERDFKAVVVGKDVAKAVLRSFDPVQ